MIPEQLKVQSPPLILQLRKASSSVRLGSDRLGPWCLCRLVFIAAIKVSQVPVSPSCDTPGVPIHLHDHSPSSVWFADRLQLQTPAKLQQKGEERELSTSHGKTD